MTWKQYTAEIEGVPTLVIVNGWFVERAPVPELPNLACFTVQVKVPAGGGLSVPEELNTLEQLEEALLEFCQHFGHGWAVYVLRIARPGLRKYHFYHGPQAHLDRASAALEEAFPSLSIGFQTREDPQWETYFNHALLDASGPVQ